jgi:hypothetical protein
MRTNQLVAILVVAAVLVVMVPSAQAEGWYVMQHRSGLTTVTDRAPNAEWSIVSGPYASEDSAIRASGVGNAATLMYGARRQFFPTGATADWGTPAAAGSMGGSGQFR